MPKSDDQLESAFVRTVLEALRGLPGPGFFWKNHGDIFTERGRPDIMGIYLGNFFCIEAKRPGKYKDPLEGADPAQRKWLSDAAKAGAYTIVADDLQAILTLVRSAGERH